MPPFQIEISGPDAEAHAENLRRQLAGSGRATVTPAPASKSLDPVVMLYISAAGLQTVDILYRFWQDWRARQRPNPGSRPALLIITADGTRIELADNDPEMVKALLQRGE